MLKAHLDAVEASLLASSLIPANAGHSLHKGTPREAFIRGFLEGHLSERVAVGSGELIDCMSKPNPPPTAQRHQYDIVLYKRDFPRLDIGGGVNAFLAESVVATIEVKSVLDSDELKKSIRAARAAKDLTRHVVTAMTAGFHPPKILNYVVAYDGPAKMSTVYGWLGPIHNEFGVSMPGLPLGPGRTQIPSPTVDGVFVLGKGFLVFDNVLFGFVTDDTRQQYPNGRWQFSDTTTGNLLYLFLLLTTAVSGTSASWLNPLPYLQSFVLPNVKIGT